MGDAVTAKHSLALAETGQYVRPVCSCGWQGDRRRRTNTSRAVLDGSQHVVRCDGPIPTHATHTLAHPTIFGWTKMRGGCHCGWEGPWYSRVQLAANSQLVNDDTDDHRRKVLAEAWGDGGNGREGW